MQTENVMSCNVLTDQDKQFGFGKNHELTQVKRIKRDGLIKGKLGQPMK